MYIALCGCGNLDFLYIPYWLKFVGLFVIILVQQFVVWGDTMGKLKEKAIDKSKAICEVESKHNIEKTLELAKQG